MVALSARNDDCERGCEGDLNQPGTAGVIMVITREHVHYGAAVSTRGVPRSG